MKFVGAFCKIFKLLLDRFCSFFRKTQKIGRENDPSQEPITHRKKHRGHHAKSQQWPFALLLFTLLLSARARCMTQLVNFVRSKDAQKQSARTSLIPIPSVQFCYRYMYYPHPPLPFQLCPPIHQVYCNQVYLFFREATPPVSFMVRRS